MSKQGSADQHRFRALDGTFTPKLLTVLREGYGMAKLQRDAVAALTVAIVALPLSMAIAIASGVSPDRGLYTAIVGGFLVSALGGSRFQIGGPAGAFIVLVSATVHAHGVDGLILATMISGVMLTIVGLSRVGSLVKFIPFPVTVGFTAGIAVIILASQIGDLLGLALTGEEPSALLPKLGAIATALPTISFWAVAISILTIAIILTLKRARPNWPGLLIAVAVASLVSAAGGLPVDTIGSVFGGIPRGLPAPALPDITAERMIQVLPSAIGFTLLGAIESLLSAVVADGMTGRRHRSNGELVAQGIANIGSGLFGGFCVTGTIARTATNVRAGAHGPVSGMLHALFLLGFMLVAAPLASYIPLAALAGLLAVIAFNMIEWHAVTALFRTSRDDALVLSVTFLLVVFRDLTEGIVAGVALASLLFIARLSRDKVIEEDPATGSEDVAPGFERDRDAIVYRLSGAFFFGSAATAASVLDSIADQRSAFVLDVSNVTMFDSSAARSIEIAARNARRAGRLFIIAGASPATRRFLMQHGIRRPIARYSASVSAATSLARRLAAKKEAEAAQA